MEITNELFHNLVIAGVCMALPRFRILALDLGKVMDGMPGFGKHPLRHKQPRH